MTAQPASPVSMGYVRAARIGGLIDFEALNPLFERVFGDKRVLREWLGHPPSLDP